MTDRARDTGRFRTDRASGLAGSVERRQGPFGALREAQTSRNLFDALIPERPVVDFDSLAGDLPENRGDIFSQSGTNTFRNLAAANLSLSLMGSMGPAITGVNSLSKRFLDHDLFEIGSDDDAVTRESRTRSTRREPFAQFSGRDYRTGERISAALDTLTPRQEAGDDIITNALKRFQSDRYAEFQNEIRDFSRQYEERIGQLQDELTKYKGGLTDVNRAYGEYADDADAILKEAASLVAEPLPESDVVGAVEASYDKFGGAMADVLKQIDSNGNEALAAEMAEQVTYMEDVIVDGLRSGLASQTNLHQLAGAQAQALANMAWKDDLYNAEKARFETELQIQAQITAKQDQIAAAQTEMNRQIADATAQFGNEIPSPDQAWDFALDGFFKEYGLNEAEAIYFRDMWDDILNGTPQAVENYETFKREVQLDVNKTNLMRAGLWEAFERRLDEGFPNFKGEKNPDTVDALLDILGSRDLATDSAAQAAFSVVLPEGFRDLFSGLDQRASIEDDGYA